MEENGIIGLFFARDERAIAEFSASYKRMCITAARAITENADDAEECFNDTCLALWNAIPPGKPASLKAYALRITRNFTLNLVKAKNRQKRAAILVELDECVSDSLPDMEPGEIGTLIDSFMESLPKREAILFLRWYNCSQPVKEIAAAMGMTENQVSKILAKMRKHLEKEGVRI